MDHQLPTVETNTIKLNSMDFGKRSDSRARPDRNPSRVKANSYFSELKSEKEGETREQSRTPTTPLVTFVPLYFVFLTPEPFSLINAQILYYTIKIYLFANLLV